MSLEFLGTIAHLYIFIDDYLLVGKGRKLGVWVLVWGSWRWRCLYIWLLFVDLRFVPPASRKAVFAAGLWIRFIHVGSRPELVHADTLSYWALELWRMQLLGSCIVIRLSLLIHAIDRAFDIASPRHFQVGGLLVGLLLFDSALKGFLLFDGWRWRSLPSWLGVVGFLILIDVGPQKRVGVLLARHCYQRRRHYSPKLDRCVLCRCRCRSWQQIVRTRHIIIRIRH